MSIQSMETAGLLDIVEQGIRQMRSDDKLEELSGLGAAQMVLREIRQRVADTGNIAGNNASDINALPHIRRDQQLASTLEALGADQDTPEPLRAVVSALMDRAEAGDLLSGDQVLLDSHTRVAVALIQERTGSGGRRIFDEAVAKASTIGEPYADEWITLLRGPAVNLIAVLTATTREAVLLRRHSPF